MLSLKDGGAHLPTGDEPSTAIEALFREHNESLLRFLQARLQSEADAREAAQEAYVRLLQLDGESRPSFPKAYLFKIAANVANDLLRRRRVRGPPVQLEGVERPHPATQERALAARQELQRVAEALEELPPRCREAFVLSRHQGLSSVDIAVRLNVTERMVRDYLARALEHIQLALDRPAVRRTLI